MIQRMFKMSMFVLLVFALLVSSVNAAVLNPSNTYLELRVDDSNSRYSLLTKEGDPTKASDNDKMLMYTSGAGAPGTSYASIKYNSDYMVYGNTSSSLTSWKDTHVPMSLVSAATTTGSGDSTLVSSTYSYNNLNVTQNLRFVTGKVLGQKDVLETEYVLTNNSVSTISTGVRMMMDNKLGSNDSAPFYVPGVGPLTTHKELTGADIPNFWQAFDSLTSPTVVSQGTLFRGDGQKPNKVQFTNWNSVMYTTWNYTNTEGTPNGDSAVVMYYEFTLPAGQTKVVRTHYGISGLVQDLTLPLGISVNADPSVQYVNGKYNPNPVIAQTYLNNLSGASVASSTLSYELPAGLYMMSGSTKKQTLSVTTGAFAVGQERVFSQKIYVENQTTDQTFSYSIKLATPGQALKTLNLSLFVPAVDNTPPSVPTDISASDITNTSAKLSWTASTDNVGVTGYEVYRNGTLVGNTVTPSITLNGMLQGQTYSITVKAYDAAGNRSAASTPYSLTTTGTAQALSEPTDIALSDNKVIEFNWVGYQIGSFTATDGDAGDTFVYSLVSGEGSEDNSDFEIEGNMLKAASVFEYKEDETFSIRVRVTDAGGNTFEKIFTIEVTQGNVRLNPTNKVATIYFDRKLFDNSAAASPPKLLKDFVKISKNANVDNPTYDALGVNDKVKISGSTLIVTFENQITTEYNRIKVEAQAFKDLLNFKSAELLTTPLITDKTGPTISKVLMSRNKKSLELRMNEKTLLATTAANLKAAIKIDRGGTGTYTALASSDKVSIITEYKIGNETIFKLGRRVVQVTLASKLVTNDNRIKIDAGALKDFAGNNSEEIITPEIEDISGPELNIVKLSPNNKQITVQFNEDAAFGSGSTQSEKLQNLKDKILLATNGTDFNALGSTDTVALTNGNLVVTLATALTGADNKLRINAGAVEDMYNTENLQLTTGSIVADSTPPACKSLDGALCDSLAMPQANSNKRLTIRFTEGVTKNATIKTLVQIKVGSEPYKALATADTVSTSKRLVTINFSKALAKDTQYKIKIGAAAVKDVTGNQNLEFETVTFEVDTEGPKLR